MASFTDKLVPFTPYVQQLPVQQMVDVGLERQRRYDAGVEKIQTAIDNVAGIDVIRPIDKQYLQSKLSSLDRDLKTMAAGDFSNYQLVNSVTGMVGSIGKDQTIKNAVYSTMNHSSQLTAINEARAKGNSAPENEDDYYTRFAKYMSSGTVGELFSDKYTPWIDVNKKLTEVAKEVGIDERTVQQLWNTDESGNIIKDKNGNPTWNPIMAEKHMKGKDASKILEAFQNALTPADYNQLAITGRYMRKSQDPIDLKYEIAENYSNNISLADGKIQEINLKLMEEEAKNVKNEDVIASLNKQKLFFENQKHNLQSSKDRDLSLVDTNPDVVKGNLYTNNYLASMSRSLSSMTEETKYSVSPQFEVTMKLNEFNRQIQRDRISDQHWAIEQERADRKELREAEKDKMEMWLKYGVGTPPPGFAASTGVDYPLDLEKDKYSIANAAKDDFGRGVMRLNDINYQITLQYFKDMNPKKSGEDDRTYDQRLRKAIGDYAKANNETYSPYSEDINTFVARFAERRINLWNTNSKAIPYEFRTMLAERNTLQKDLTVKQARIEGIRKEAAETLRQQGLEFPSDVEIAANIKGVNLVVMKSPWTLPTTHPAYKRAPFAGHRDEKVKVAEYHLTREDIINLVNAHPEVTNTWGQLTVDDNQADERDRARRKLLAKFGDRDLAEIESEVFGTVLFKNEVSGGVNRVYSGIRNEQVRKAAKFLRKSNYDKLAEIEAQLYQEKGYFPQPKAYPILRGKENEQDMNSRMTTIVNKYSGNLNEEKNFNTEDVIATILSGKQNAVQVIERPGISPSDPIDYEMMVSDNKGKTRTFKIDAKDYTYLTKNAPTTYNAPPKVVSQIDFYGTSGKDGTNSPSQAWFGSDEFVNLKGVDYTVTANLIPDKANSDNLWLKLYVHKPDGKVETLTYDTPLPKRNADGSFNQDLDIVPIGITANVIEQLRKR